MFTLHYITLHYITLHYVLLRYLMNYLSNLDETYNEYSLAPTGDLIRSWRSKIKITAGLSMWWWSRRHWPWSLNVHQLVHPCRFRLALSILAFATSTVLVPIFQSCIIHRCVLIGLVYFPVLHFSSLHFTQSHNFPFPHYQVTLQMLGCGNLCSCKLRALLAQLWWDTHLTPSVTDISNSPQLLPQGYWAILEVRHRSMVKPMLTIISIMHSSNRMHCYEFTFAHNHNHNYIAPLRRGFSGAREESIRRHKSRC